MFFIVKKNLFFHLPEVRAVSGKGASAAEVVVLSSDHIHRHAAARVKVSGVVLAVRVDRHEYSLIVALS